MAQPTTTPNATPNVPRSWDNQKDHLGKIADAINNALRGKLNNTGSVTLTANTMTTTLSDIRIGINSVVLLQPTTANAAAALTNVYFGTSGNGSVILTHSNTATTDRSFRYTILG